MTSPWPHVPSVSLVHQQKNEPTRRRRGTFYQPKTHPTMETIIPLRILLLSALYCLVLSPLFLPFFMPQQQPPPQEEANHKRRKMSTPSDKYSQDGAEAKEIAKYLPYFPFKGIPRFYDIGGFLYEPAIFQKIVDIFADRYRELEVDVIAGLDARGFVLGPPIALALKKPFIMMRKKGKMPNSISSDDYKVEYGTRSGLTVQRDRILPGQRVLIIDDLVATGGTLGSAISLVKMLQGIPVECACVVELKMFINPPADSGLPSRTKLFRELGHEHVPVWGLISEDILTNEAKLPKDYVDDGEEH